VDVEAAFARMAQAAAEKAAYAKSAAFFHHLPNQAKPRARPSTSTQAPSHEADDRSMTS
jgi:hypothetical protein